MSVNKLVKFFGTFTKLPVYAEDVRDQIVELGIQDHIQFQPMDEDPQKLKGMFLRYRVRTTPYGECENHIVIFYNQNVLPDEQNYICVKELMHVFDDKIKGVVQSEEDLKRHLSVLFPSASEAKHSSLSGFLDLAAEFLALVIMVPEECRDDLALAVQEGRMTEQDFAAIIGIPLDDANELLSNKWQVVSQMLKTLIDGGLKDAAA